MGTVKEATARYDAVREAHGLWIDETALEEAREFGAGSVALQTFGGGADALDCLFLMAELLRTLPVAMSIHVDLLLEEEERSWGEIAAALGVSRQAAVKRFR